MNTTLAKKALLLKHSRVLSLHTWYDEDGWRGTCGVFFGRYHFQLRHRWSGEVALDQVVWCWEPGYDSLVKDWRSVVAKFIHRLAENEKGLTAGQGVSDPVLEQTHPALHEHLVTDWLEGSKRITSSLGINIDQGRWKARLADRENGMVLFVTGDSFQGVLDVLESTLRGDSADWRVDQFASNNGAKKKNRG